MVDDLAPDCIEGQKACVLQVQFIINAKQELESIQ